MAEEDKQTLADDEAEFFESLGDFAQMIDVVQFD